MNSWDLVAGGSAFGAVLFLLKELADIAKAWMRNRKGPDPKGNGHGGGDVLEVLERVAKYQEKSAELLHELVASQRITSQRIESIHTRLDHQA